MATRAHRLFIDGKWVEAASGATYTLPNPATEETVALAADAGREDMERAIAAARRSFDAGTWRRSSRRDRARVLEHLADGLEKRRDELRQILVSAHACEYVTHPINIDRPLQFLRRYADLALHFEFDRMLPPHVEPSPMGGPARVVSSMTHRQPVGVCGLIPTWNFPLYVSVQKIGPALATGCSMVMKPSPWGPLPDLLVAEILEECDLPPGVFNVVTGQSPELGALLTESRQVDMISFTGSHGVGKKIMQAGGATLKRMHLELGGKSALIFLDDASFESAGPMAASASYFHAGQGCAIFSRVLVPRPRHDELVEKMKAFVEGVVKVGDPADPSVLLGPVIRSERRTAIEAYIESGRREGADLVTGGGRPAGLPKGFFLQPTIFANVRNETRIAREEIFGPVVSVLPYGDEAEAIRIANDSELGLSGGIVTRDAAKAIALAKQIRTGGVSVNGANNPFAPFGGFKDSGLGREGMEAGMETYTELQTIAW
jgi:acyl-CoA reductase-like NAD-dependent aldehyde dehydrogenase